MDLIIFLLLLIFEFIKMDWLEFVIAITGSFTALIAFGALVFSMITFRQNQKFIRKQQFESTFFNMMKQLEDIVSKLSIEDIITIKEKSSTTNSGGITYTDKIVIHSFTGRNAFRY